MSGFTTPGGARGSHRTGGFTLIETTIVLLIGALLLGFGINGLSQVASDRAARGARDSFIWLARRAQSTAIQRGSTMRVTLNPAAARGQILAGWAGGTTVDQIAFATEYDVTVRSSTGDSIVVCYGPRGYSAGGCSSPTLPAVITFSRGPQSARATVQLLGQVEASQ